MTRRAWTDDEIAELRRRYPDMPTGDLAREMGRTPHSVYEKAHRLGLSKSAAYLGGPYVGLLFAADAPTAPAGKNEKHCSACATPRHLDLFDGDARSPDGKVNICKICRRQRYPRRATSRPRDEYRPAEEIFAEARRDFALRLRNGLGPYVSPYTQGEVE